jgi:hypothetical protein
LKSIGINLDIEQLNPSPDVDMLDSGSGSNQLQDVDMLNLEDNTEVIDTVMTDLAPIESESDRFRIAEARLVAMQNGDGESEIGKLNHIREIDARLKVL